MIHPDSRTKGWIEHVANEYRIRDIALVEKTIRAFSLLESLVRSGCPLLFKGGTACMIHLNSALHIRKETYCDNLSFNLVFRFCTTMLWIE